MIKKSKRHHKVLLIKSKLDGDLKTLTGDSEIPFMTDIPLAFTS